MARRNQRYTHNASFKQCGEVASLPEVRSFINGLMNAAILTGNFIADGRDLGTAVLEPDLKFFMIAI